MATAYVDGADVKFPSTCIGCDGVPETTYELEARRGTDFIIVAQWEFVAIPVPICLACRRRRRIVGLATYAGGLLFILGGGFVTMTLAINEWKLAATVVGATILTVALGLRTCGDALIQWASLGVTTGWLKGAGTRLRLRFRRDGYLAAWLAVNPGAVFSATALRQPKTMEEDVSENEFIYSRLLPAGTLAAMLILLALHHWYAMANRSVYPVAVLFLTTSAGFAAGGTVYPPLFSTAGAHGRHLPSYLKVVGGLCAAVGFALGFYLLQTVYTF
jgi:hypothetical protein